MEVLENYREFKQKCILCKRNIPNEAFAVVDGKQLKRCWACHVRLSRIKWERERGYRPPAGKDKCSYKRYGKKLIQSVEEPLPDFGGYLTVVCTNCGKRFNPTLHETNNRISAISSMSYSGENRLYCSSACKKNCSIFNQKTHHKGLYKADQRELQGQLRNIVLERDKNICQICGENKNLICHHITGVKQNPIESADADNCITVCKHCHKNIHNLPGCTPTDLRC